MVAGLLRRLRSARLTREIVARLAVGYLRLCRATIRWDIVENDVRPRIRSGEGRWVLAIWHGRLMMIPSEMNTRLDVRAIISRNRDGDIISRTVGLFGIGTIRGSSRDPSKPMLNKGGQDAFRNALDILQKQENVIVALTPDGPRGPLRRCQPGVARISAQARAVVVPWTFSVAHGWQLRSWDTFIVPRPFSRGVIAYGTPISPPADDDPGTLEIYRLAIEQALNDLTDAADRQVGRACQAPAPVQDASPLHP